MNIQDDEKPYDIGNVQLCIQWSLTMTGTRTSGQRLIVVYDFIPREKGHTGTHTDPRDCGEVVELSTGPREIS